MTEPRKPYSVERAPIAAARSAVPKKKKIPRPPSNLEELLLLQMRAANLPPANREWKFHKTRQWRFDFAWPSLRLAVECEGGTFTNGGHTRGAYYRENCLKYNAAALDGWTVLRYDMALIRSGQALEDITKALCSGVAQL